MKKDQESFRPTNLFLANTKRESRFLKGLGLIAAAASRTFDAQFRTHRCAGVLIPTEASIGAPQDVIDEAVEVRGGRSMLATRYQAQGISETTV